MRARRTIRSILLVPLALAACGGGSKLTPPAGRALAAASPAATARDEAASGEASVEQAIAFVADVEGNLRKLWEARDRANWIHENFVTDDTEALAAKGEEETADYVRRAIVQSRRFAAITPALPKDVARKL